MTGRPSSLDHSSAAASLRPIGGSRGGDYTPPPLRQQPTQTFARQRSQSARSPGRFSPMTSMAGATPRKLPARTQPKPLQGSGMCALTHRAGRAPCRQTLDAPRAGRPIRHRRPARLSPREPASPAPRIPKAIDGSPPRRGTGRPVPHTPLDWNKSAPGVSPLPNPPWARQGGWSASQSLGTLTIGKCSPERRPIERGEGGQGNRSQNRGTPSITVHRAKVPSKSTMTFTMTIGASYSVTVNLRARYRRSCTGRRTDRW